MSTMNKKGTISLETAISFSVVMLFITAIISVTTFLRTDILMQRAVEQSCEDLGYCMPFSIITSDSVSTLVNALPDSVEGTGYLEQIGAIAAGADEFTEHGLRAAALNLLFGRSFTDDLASEYAEYNGNYFFGPDEIYVDFDINNYYIDVYVVYSVNTIIGPVSREISAVIPFYGDFELFLSESEASGSDGSSIWQENNFVRGRYFADKYGANLPPTFPSVNYYGNGQVISIVSIDLNRATYSSPAVCMMRVTQQIDQIASFDGADVQINGTRYTVNGNDIDQRTLIVVIPEDSPESGRAAVYSLQEYAALSGVQLQIEEDGASL